MLFIFSTSPKIRRLFRPKIAISSTGVYYAQSIQLFSSGLDIGG